MKAHIKLDDDLLAKARDYTGIEDAEAVVNEALLRLIRREAAKRLIALGGTMPDLAYTPQRKQEPE